jgi:hypothetical protein
MAKPFRLQAVKATENQVKNAILRYLTIERRVVWAARMNTGKGKLLRPDGSQTWISFGFTGCPDIMGMLRDGRYLAIECKRADGRVRPDQQKHITQAADHGAVAIIARSVEDVQMALDAATATHAGLMPAQCANGAYSGPPGDVIAAPCPDREGDNT